MRFLVLFLTCLIPVTASAQVKLERKITDNQKALVKSETELNQTMTLAGMELPTKVTQFLETEVTNGQRNADGAIEVTHKIRSMQQNMALPGGLSINFDSGNPDQKSDNPQLDIILDAVKFNAKAEKIFTFDKKNTATSAKLTEDASSLNELLRDEFKSENLVKAMKNELKVLPQDTVKKGDTWESEIEQSFGGGQIMTFSTNYTYHGTIEKEGRELDRITMKVSDVDFDIDGSNPAFPLGLKNHELKVVESDGTILFDRRFGRIVEVDTKIHIKGALTLTAMGQELPGSLDLSMKSKSTVAVVAN